jgi:hypothetical protein
MFKKIVDLFKHTDLIDWLLGVGFVVCFTAVGYALVDYPLWLVFPAAAVVLLVIAKNRRERMLRNGDDEDSEKK